MFSYRERNQLETYTLPNAGSGAAVEQRVYDDSKRLKEVSRPGGKLVTFQYKPQSDRLTRIVSPRGNTDFDYDATTSFVSEIEEPDGQKLGFVRRIPGAKLESCKARSKNLHHVFQNTWLFSKAAP